ncbi:MAG: hypothetical protein NTZ55_03220 [Candidatus Roizmanbacteria bacterium]|nr:hypothetical protein [Candidatus Roizmanbacteria bacterium]
MESDIKDQQVYPAMRPISSQGRLMRIAKNITLSLGVLILICTVIWLTSFLFRTKDQKRSAHVSVVLTPTLAPTSITHTTPTPTYIPLPIATIISPNNLNPTLSPLVNWKSYQYDKCEDNINWRMPFTFKIPADWVESIRYASNGATTSSYTYTSPNIKFQATCGDGFGGGGCGLVNTLIQDTFVANGRFISGCFEKDKSNGKLLLWLTYLHPLTNKGPGLSFTGEGEDTPENRLFINQIISSFKLIGQE